MTIGFTLNDAVDNDQSSGLQVGADSGSHDDTDVSVASLNGGTTLVFYNRLVFLGLLPDAFATDVGAASELNSVTVTPSGNGSITHLGFSGEFDDNGTPGDPSDDTATPLVVYTGGNWASGGDTGLQTVDGDDIHLFRDADAGLGDQLVFGITSTGDIVFAVYMYTTVNPDGSVNVDFHTITFEALYNPDDTDPDDEIDLGDYLTIAASENIVFDFEGTPAGKNLFTMVLADTSDPDGFGVVVTPDTEVIELNTSKGGGPTTLALYNQMINPGETLVFTFMNDPVDSYTVIPGDPNDLDQNEADLEENILFGSLEYITGGSVIISQTQGPGPHSLILEATAADNTETTGNGFINGYADDSSVAITSVTVYDDLGAPVDTWLVGDSGTTTGGVTVTYIGDTVQVDGFSSDYTIAYETAAPIARLFVTGVAGKFDIGGLGVDQPGAAVAPVGSNVVYDDDGPTAVITDTGIPVVHDESAGEQNDPLLVNVIDTTLDDILGTDDLNLYGAIGNGDTLEINGELVFTYGAGNDGTTVAELAAAIDAFDAITAADFTSGDLLVTREGSHAVLAFTGSIATSLGLATYANADNDDDAVEDNNDDDQSAALPGFFSGGAIGWAMSAEPVVSSSSSDTGTDGGEQPVSEVWSLDIGTPGFGFTDPDSGFDDLDGHNILLRVEGDLVVGRVDDDDDGAVDNGDTIAIEIAIDQDGFLSVAQNIPIKHPTALADERVIMNDSALLAVLTVTDADGDEHEVTEEIGDKVIIEDDAPEAAPLDLEVLEEDDLDGSGTELSTGNDNDGTDGAGDSSGTRETATIVLDPALNIFQGADQPVSYNFKDVNQATLDAALPALVSMGDAVTYTLTLNQTTNVAGDTDVITAMAGGRLIFTIEVIDLELSGGDGANIIFTLNDQLDHVVEAAPGSENTLLQLFGGGSVGTIDVTNLLDFQDKDGDPVILPAGYVSYNVIDDRPEISGPSTDPGVVDFIAGQSVGYDLNGSVGSDENDASNENWEGTKTYTFTFAVDADETITSTSIAGLEALVSADGTTIQFFVDGFGGNPVDGLVQAGELFFDVVLGDQGGSGDYTFNVYMGAPPAFTPFDFTDLPSGQNLHGTIAADKTDLTEGGILLFPSFVDLDGDGVFTHFSDTTNTSKGGGPVTIGNSNQMFDPGEGHYFVYVDNPDAISVAGVGLDQNNADDADTVGFDGTIEVTKAQVEIVQVQGGSLASMTIEAFDLDNVTLGDVGTGDTTDPRDFLLDPESAGNATTVNITEVIVYGPDGTTILEHWQDVGPIDGVYVNLVDDASINVIFNNTGGGVYTATVSGVDDNYTIEWTTEDPHDMALIEGVAGKYDIGGFNLLQINETPDQLFDFTLDITDFDGDTASSSFQVLVDGTGIYDDGVFDLTP